MSDSTLRTPKTARATAAGREASGRLEYLSDVSIQTRLPSFFFESDQVHLMQCEASFPCVRRPRELLTRWLEPMVELRQQRAIDLLVQEPS
jgi:hypothetical protein